ncbi:hypothetical protein BJ322DRAFT_1105463 [Thelephora terrestris]|uniref:Uncharacterized protein n=1 Tax=Thelephora terrestris TaxID=56493 RepID=A0A9P6HLI8_9AGAM|nr:hypothetical protein BJ322DRAFT_1105463 [Thelephora terrestris]
MGDLSTTWTPDQGPNAIAPFKEYKIVENDDETPNPGTGWSKKEMRALITNSPACEEVMWKCVLAIWRLRSMEERLEREESLAGPWAEHMVAWLSRHRDLCRAFHVNPFEIILNYARQAVKNEHIAPHMVPEFANYESTPAPPARGSASHTPVPREDIPIRASCPTNPRPSRSLSDKDNALPYPRPTGTRSQNKHLPIRRSPDGCSDEELVPRTNILQSSAPQMNVLTRSSLQQTPAPQEVFPITTRLSHTPAPQELVPRTNILQSPAPQEDVPMRSSVSQTPSPWEDVPMDEEAVLVVPRKVDKGKSRAGEEQGVKKKTRPRPMEKKVPSTQPTIGTKRELSNSPSKEDGPSTSTKKRRGGKARSFLAGGLDLGVITVNEGAPVDTTMVPLAKQRVCIGCESRDGSRESCLPQWCGGQERINIQCQKCKNRKQGCSFRAEHFGIEIWPVLIPKDEAPQTESESVVDVPSIATRASGPITRSKKAKSTRYALRNAAPSTAPPSTRPAMVTPQTTAAVATVHSPSPIGPSAGDPNAANRTTLYYADLTPFGVVAQDPEQSLLDLQLYRTQLRTIMRREWNDVSEVLATGSERSQIGAQLLASLNVAIVERGGRPLFPRSDFEPTVADMINLETDAFKDQMVRSAAGGGIPDFEGPQGGNSPPQP